MGRSAAGDDCRAIVSGRTLKVGFSGAGQEEDSKREFLEILAMNAKIHGQGPVSLNHQPYIVQRGKPPRDLMHGVSPILLAG